jgi:4-amino-4-deoxy-L-arabinose transferase-like glycosyltransferase
MNGWMLFRAFRAMVGVIIMFLVCTFAVVYGIREEWLLESAYQKEYGAAWQTYYEEKHGPLAAARRKFWIGPVGLVVVFGLAYAVYRQIAGPSHRRSSRRRRSRA